MLRVHPLLYRVLFVIPVLLSLFLGIASCRTKVAAFSPLTMLSIVGGNVLIQKPGSSSWNAGKEGMTLQAGDKIKTDTSATATITFFDGSTISLNGSTEISLDELLNKSSTIPKTIKIGQTIGETSSNIIKLVDPASRYEIDTQSGVAAVRGSKMVVQVVTDGTTSVYNVEGAISFTAQGQEVMIPVGSVSTAKPGAVPNAPQPGLPPEFGGLTATSISSQTGWQQTGLYLNAGDKFYVEYRGGSWTVDYTKFSYIGPAGYSVEIDKTIAAGYKFDSSVPYGYLLGKVGNGEEIFIGNKGGPFTADVSGFLFLRINDIDSALGYNDGAITVGLRGAATNLTSPTTTSTPPMVAAGHDFTVGLKADGTVIAVGDNSSGQCNVSTWHNIVQVATGHDFTVGLKADGTVVAVGNSQSGQLNVTGWTNIIQVAAGDTFTVGLVSNGTIIVAGADVWDNYGDKYSDINKSGPFTQVAAQYSMVIGLKSDSTFVSVGYQQAFTGSNAKQVSAGNFFLNALEFDGTLVGAGDNANHQVDGIGSWTNIIQVAAGNEFTVALESDGHVKAVGSDEYGRVSGVSSWANIIQVAVGAEHTVGLKADGTVVATGYNASDQCDVNNWYLGFNISNGQTWTPTSASTTTTATTTTSTTVNPTNGIPTTSTTSTSPTTFTITTTQISTPLTQVNVWLTTLNDSTANPVSALKVGSVTTLYIWAQGGNDQTGDFNLSGILQNGTQMQLGSTKHATPGNVIYCGQWNGGFLNTVGPVTVNATSGGTTVGSTTINITN